MELNTEGAEDELTQAGTEIIILLTLKIMMVSFYNLVC